MTEFEAAKANKTFSASGYLFHKIISTMNRRDQLQKFMQTHSSAITPPIAKYLAFLTYDSNSAEQFSEASEKAKNYIEQGTIEEEAEKLLPVWDFLLSKPLIKALHPAIDGTDVLDIQALKNIISDRSSYEAETLVTCGHNMPMPSQTWPQQRSLYDYKTLLNANDEGLLKLARLKPDHPTQLNKVWPHAHWQKIWKIFISELTKSFDLPEIANQVLSGAYPAAPKPTPQNGTDYENMYIPMGENSFNNFELFLIKIRFIFSEWLFSKNTIHAKQEEPHEEHNQSRRCSIS